MTQPLSVVRVEVILCRWSAIAPRTTTSGRLAKDRSPSGADIGLHVPGQVGSALVCIPGRGGLKPPIRSAAKILSADGDVDQMAMKPAK